MSHMSKDTLRREGHGWATAMQVLAIGHCVRVARARHFRATAVDNLDNRDGIALLRGPQRAAAYHGRMAKRLEPRDPDQAIRWLMQQLVVSQEPWLDPAPRKPWLCLRGELQAKLEDVKERRGRFW